MKKIIFVLLICLTFTSCAPSPVEIQKAITETQTAMPTPTKFSDEYIESQLYTSDFYHVDELGLEPGPIINSSTDVYWFRSISTFESAFGLYLGSNKIDGNITVFLFKTTGDASSAMSITKNNVKELAYIYPGNAPNIIGDDSIFFTDTKDKYLARPFVVFQTCRVIISINALADPTVIFDYSKRMEKRIRPISCN